MSRLDPPTGEIVNKHHDYQLKPQICGGWF